MFKDKVLLITGGTGSFGNAVLRRFLDSDIREIRICYEWSGLYLPCRCAEASSFL